MPIPGNEVAILHWGNNQLNWLNTTYIFQIWSVWAGYDGANQKWQNILNE